MPSEQWEERRLLKAAAEYVKSRIDEEPEIGIILGSGFGPYAETVEAAVRVPYGEIPGFLPTGIPGHRGELVCGLKVGRRVLVQSGRFHCYEGHTARAVAFPVRVMATLGIRRLIITNASGAINLDFHPGELMLISDHINLSGQNPLTGPNDAGMGPRFPDCTEAYTKPWRRALATAAEAQGIRLREGVYAMMPGPSFETPAEIRALRCIGADAVGMSSVPEVIAAAHAGMAVLGVSCLTNMAAGVLDQPLSAGEVLEVGKQAADTIAKVLDLALEQVDA